MYVLISSLVNDNNKDKDNNKDNAITKNENNTTQDSNRVCTYFFALWSTAIQPIVVSCIRGLAPAFTVSLMKLSAEDPLGSLLT